jgi:single-strand DNA-binding protein
MVNRVTLVCRVGKTPEVRQTSGDNKCAKFSVATSETYKNKSGEKIVHTEWHNIVVWRKLADVAEKYVVKGTLLYIEGKIRNKSWEDKDGNKRYSYEIEAESFQMLSPRDNSTQQDNSGFVPDVPGVDQQTGEVFDHPDMSGSSGGAGVTDDLPF